ARHGSADPFNPLVAPRPDGRAHKMDGGRARSAQLFFESQIEVGRIDADENIGWYRAPAPLDVAIDPQKAGQTTEGINIPEHGQRMHGMPGVKAFGVHGGPTDAVTGRAGYPLMQPSDDAACQQIARGFSGHQADT